GVRLLHDARNDAALGHGEVLPLPGEELLRPHERDGADGLLPHVARLVAGEAEGVHLGAAAAATGADLDAAVWHHAEVGDLLRHADGVIDRWADVEDAGDDADASRLYADGEAGEVRRRPVRVLLEAVVLGRPVGVEAGGVSRNPDLDVATDAKRL